MPCSYFAMRDEAHLSGKIILAQESAFVQVAAGCSMSVMEAFKGCSRLQMVCLMVMALERSMLTELKL